MGQDMAPCFSFLEGNRLWDTCVGFYYSRQIVWIFDKICRVTFVCTIIVGRMQQKLHYILNQDKFTYIRNSMFFVSKKLYSARMSGRFSTFRIQYSLNNDFYVICIVSLDWHLCKFVFLWIRLKRSNSSTNINISFYKYKYFVRNCAFYMRYNIIRTMCAPVNFS